MLYLYIEDVLLSIEQKISHRTMTEYLILCNFISILKNGKYLVKLEVSFL